MSDNYAVINGKRVELTDEQVKALGIERKNPFERMHQAKTYFYIDEHGRVKSYYDTRLPFDEKTYDNVNYFNDEQFAKQVALHQLLYRKLLKFAYDNGFEDNQAWNCENRHYYVCYSHTHKIFTTEFNYDGKRSAVYFPSSEAATRAIDEVIKPFMEEHPEFVW